MRRRIALLVALFVSAAAVTSRGQDQLPVTLFSKCGAVRIEFILGRLTIIPQHRGQVRLTKSPQGSEELNESLLINNDDASPVVRYQYTDARQTVEFEVINCREVNLMAQRKLDGSVHTVEFHQPLQGDIDVKFSLDEHLHYHVVKARSFWHLMLTDRSICERELVPVLELFRQDWHLAELGEQVESGLFQSALSKPLISRRYLSELVSQLNAPQFQKRQTADSQLRLCGPSALPFLESLPRQSLSGEQRFRIDRIRRSIAVASTDSADRAAEWLVDDEQVWFALLKHQDPQRRHLAAIRLTAMRSQSLEFDPYGDESYRQEQLAQLKSQIIRR